MFSPFLCQSVTRPEQSSQRHDDPRGKSGVKFSSNFGRGSSHGAFLWGFLTELTEANNVSCSVHYARARRAGEWVQGCQKKPASALIWMHLIKTEGQHEKSQLIQFNPRVT